MIDLPVIVIKMPKWIQIIQQLILLTIKEYLQKTLKRGNKLIIIELNLPLLLKILPLKQEILLQSTLLKKTIILHHHLPIILKKQFLSI